MSHFTVLVVTNERPTEETLSQALLPYHEYECTGFNAYLQFVPFDDFEEDYTKYGENRAHDVFAREWYGEHAECRDGKWGRMTNPNKKWDWYTVGGRWNGLLRSWGGERANTLRKSDLDFEAMAADRMRQRAAQWAEYEQRKAAARATDTKHDATARFVCNIPEGVDQETFLATDRANLTFAILMNGRWHEKGRMGWFALVSDEKADWPEQYAHILETVPADAWLTVVDCHI